MNYDDVEETATHEVTHLIENSHDTTFTNLHIDVKTGTWRPEYSGGLRVGSGGYENDTKKRRQSPKNTTICSHHSCPSKNKVECKYCHKMFCEDHIKAKEPRASLSVRLKPSLDNIDSENGHACPDLVSFKLDRNKKIEKDFADAFKKPEFEKYEEPSEEIHDDTSSEPEPEPEKDEEVFKKSLTIKEDNKYPDYKEVAEDKEFRFVKPSFAQKIRCKLNQHGYQRVGNAYHVGNGKVKQNYRCKFCGKITYEIS